MLSQLREIGWTLWDPIGILHHRDDAPDEYDTYLLKIAAMLSASASDVECIDYLIDVECNHMGLGMKDDSRKRAAATVDAIRKIV